ncbi:MAG: Rne/Rng family ribonuclease [Gomphosphaeria aponina SAG 52.96 = DSM 107014]|uniref:Rne/Rng family ribonuclease n=1 Tax=Gomphosphaeria aponina SAG 52.96 = DSM 107014 TaxID=1521640 RepID=A0A941JSZ0_9CHRO|nr:Rne/Rng family ribonuclease [Gomphosphaeria aponina SAG 52.96 = DSM 107014]
MPKQIIIAEQHHIAAVFSEDQIQELVVATGNQQVGDIYLGIVENVISGIDAAFVNIGDAERNGFIHVTDLGPLRLKKSAGAITELLSPQQKVLVQVIKEPTGNKGPRLTGNITLPGRYLVLMPSGKGVNLSRRIRSENERSRLRALAILVKPAGMGLLVRTEAEGKAEEAIMEDLEFLQKQWESIQQQAISTRPPALLNRDDDFIQRVLRDMYTAEVNRIVVSSEQGMKRVKQHLSNWSGGRSPEGVLIDYHLESQPILEYFRVNAAIKEALKPRVELPSGGYIIIEPTEALTVIDVNSGSFTRSATARETVLWTNSEAATEIARQLRLRNIGGVIIVDFIDMDSRRDQLKLLEHFNKILKADKARPQIAQLSELGLVELTRKRQGKNIYELFGHTCPTCGGVGHVVHLRGDGDEKIIEPPISVSGPTLVVKSPERPVLQEEKEFFIELPLEIEPEEENPELELLNHPSYQDPLTGINTNRRRRKRRLTESLITEEATPEEEVKVEEEEYLETSEVDDSQRENLEQTQIIERKERSQPRMSRGATTEKIVVEMTPLQQEVYALMGVSPLKLLEQDPPNSKSIIVSVKCPGETDTDVEQRENKREINMILTNESEEESMEMSDVSPLFRRRRRRPSTIIN